MATQNFTSIFTAQKINARLQELIDEAGADHQEAVDGELTREQLQALSDRSVLRGVSLGNVAFAIRMMSLTPDPSPTGEGN